MEATAQNTQQPQQQETKWYVLRVVSGKERKVKEYLDKEVSRGGWSEVVKQVFLPVEKVYKVQNGKKVMRERNYYPGYVMIEIADGKLGDDLRDVIKNTSNVIHFLGKENPIALRKAEVNKMLGKMDEMAEAGGVSMSEPFIVGETIKIIEGPFNAPSSPPEIPVPIRWIPISFNCLLRLMVSWKNVFPPSIRMSPLSR